MNRLDKGWRGNRLVPVAIFELGNRRHVIPSARFVGMTSGWEGERSLVSRQLSRNACRITECQRVPVRTIYLNGIVQRLNFQAITVGAQLPGRRKQYALKKSTRGVSPVNVNDDENSGMEMRDRG